VNSLVSVLLSSSKTLTTSFAINCAKKHKNATNYNTGAQEFATSIQDRLLHDYILYHKKMQTDYNPGAHELKPA
jgi:hypothetical protein